MLALLFAARIGLGFQFQTLVSVGDDIAAEFGVGYTEVGSMIGMFMVPGMFLALIAGFAGGRFSDRLLVGFGMGLLAAGGAIGAFADSTLELYVARAVCGAGFVFGNLYFTKMIADWFSGREIATAMSFLVMSWPFGIAMGQIGHEWLAATAGWRLAFAAAAIWCAASALFVLLLYRTPPGPAAQVFRRLTIPRLGRRELALILIASAAWGIFNAAYVIYLTFAPLLLEADGMSSTTAAGIVSIGSWVMIFSGTIAGQIADRTGKPDIVLYVGLLGGIAALLLLPMTSMAVGVSLLFGLLGVAPAGIIMALTGEAMRPESRAFGIGIFFTGYYLIMTVAPPLAGWLYDRSGDTFDPILLAVALFAVVAFCNLAFRTVKARGPLAE